MRAVASALRARSSSRGSLLTPSCWFASLAFLCSIIVAGDAVAQSRLVLDGSLPNGRTDDLVATQTGPVYAIDETMGAASGGNLLHSFRDFSIGSGDTAEFLSSQPFDRVLLRVTGGDASTLNGTLRSTIVDGLGNGADFFFVNPNGILFGSGASIDVPSHLYISTADTLRFDDGALLETGSATSPILTTADPVEFGFLGDDRAAPIEFVENTIGGFGFLTLRMSSGTTLAAIGGDVRLAGPSGFLVVEAPSGRLALVATGSSEATVAVSDFEVSAVDSENLGTVSIEPGALVDVRNPFVPADGQGEVVVRGGRFVVDGGFVNAGGNGGATDLAIDVRVDERVDVRGGGVILVNSDGDAPTGRALVAAREIAVSGVGSSIATRARSDVAGGRVELDADVVSIVDGGSIVSLAEGGTGDGGSISIRADAVVLDGGGEIRSETATAGRGGAIEVEATDVEIVDGEIRTTDDGGGRAGSIRIDAESIRVDGSTSAVAIEQSASSPDSARIELGRGVGMGSVRLANGGVVSSVNDGNAVGPSIRVATGEFVVRDGARVETATVGSGAGGGIDIEATRLEVGRTAGQTLAGLVNSTSSVGATGEGGRITVRVDEMSLEGGGQISTTSQGADAGSISIEVSGDVLVRGNDGAAIPSGVFARTDDLAVGSGGDIAISARSIRVEDGAGIRTNADGGQDAGDLRLVASDTISVIGRNSLIAAEGEVGASGDVDLVAERIELREGAAVSLQNPSDRAGGRLRIVGGHLEVSGTDEAGQPTLVNADAGGSGGIGGVEIDLRDHFLLSDGAQISTRSTNTGRAGDVSIAAGSISILNGAEITTEALSTADAGFIGIESAGDFMVSDSALSTAASQRFGGTIDLTAGGLLTLDRSEVTARVRNEISVSIGDGGDVFVTAPFIILNDAAVVATAEAGAGGDIELTSENLLQTTSTTLDASSEFGQSGVVLATSPAADLTGQIENLSARFENVADRLRRDCDQRTQREGSFTVEVRTAAEDRFEEDDLDFQSSVRPSPTGGGACPTD